MLTTPPPILDAVKDFPEPAPLARTAGRPHPRRARDGSVGASELGGAFLWPRDEPWPAYDEARVDRFVQQILGAGNIDGEAQIPEGTSIPFAPILQPRAADFPEMPFPDDADLFQLLWFPYLLEVPEGMKSPDSSFDYRVSWRRTATVGALRASGPAMVETYQGSFARPSRLDPERVVEYPNSQDLDPKLERRIDRWKAARKVDRDGDSPIDLDNWECSACPSTKVGGHVFWVQEKRVPTCSRGRAMAHLLSVADAERDGGTARRRQPVEDRLRGHRTDRDRIGSPPDLGNFGLFDLLACRDCDGFPTRAATARRAATRGRGRSPSGPAGRSARPATVIRRLETPATQQPTHVESADSARGVFRRSQRAGRRRPPRRP